MDHQTAAATGAARIVPRPPRPPRAVTVVRSAIYAAASVVWLLVMSLAAMPVLFLGRPRGWPLFRFWARGNLFLLRVLAGQRVRVLGRENIPQAGALVAAKHMAPWETFAFVPLMPQPVYVLKRELLKIPVWGHFARHFGMIAIDRSGGGGALMAMAKAAGAAVDRGAQVVIFPEGTRKRPGEAPDYKTGVALLYRSLSVPCTPVALDSGLFCELRSFIRYPGTITVSFLPALPAGLSRAAFLEALQEAIETETDRLMAEAPTRR